ncbi:membrane bound O-acyl transferase family-domain-containing protein [Hypomontagnella monticulosa]|nr:membrane bound O-acyl transferase family-domain-containing protein [Hypomontagnella monticulosa]
MEWITPIVCYTTAVALVFIGLYIPESQRNGLLPPIMGLLGYSVWQCRHLNQIPGVSFQFAMTVVITILNAPLVLHAKKEPMVIQIRQDGSWNLNAITAYKRMINPRMLPAKEWSSDGAKPRPRWVVVLQDVLKVVALILLRSKLRSFLVAIVSSSSLWDFSSSREPLVRRLIAGCLTLRDLGLRSFISLFWIVDTAIEVDLSHTILRLLFVGVLGLDKPHEWPPMFGSVLEAYTIKRFWGVFWHRLFTPAAGKWGRILVKKGLNRRTPSLVEKMFVAFFIFSMSGVVHVIIDWRLGRDSSANYIFFYWSNFLAVTFEVMVTKIWPRHIAWVLMGFYFVHLDYTSNRIP